MAKIKTVKVEIPGEVGAELVKEYGFNPFTQTCRIIFETENHKHYTSYPPKILVGTSQFTHCYLEIISQETDMGNLKRLIYKIIQELA